MARFFRREVSMKNDQNEAQIISWLKKLTEKQQIEVCVYMYENMADREREKLNSALRKYLKNLARIQDNVNIETNVAIMSSKERESWKEDSIKLLESIEDEEYKIQGQIEYDYTYDYYDDSESVSYEDPDDVAGKIMQIIFFANGCFKSGYYQDALDLYDRLWALTIAVDVEYYDEESLTLDELVKNQLLAADLGQMAEYTLYADYQVREPEERVEDMYQYFRYPAFDNVSMEKALTSGKEKLENTELFWREWIAFLSSKYGQRETQLLEEAALYCGGAELLEKVAEKNYCLHPQLVLDAMESYKNTEYYEKMERCGEKAVERMNHEYCIRSEIAKQTALAYEYQNKKYDQGVIWQEIFRSDSTIKNLLFFFAADPKRARHYPVYKNDGKVVNYQNSRELQRNQISKDQYVPLRLLMGDFDEVEKYCKQYKDPVGWTGSFMKETIAMFLLFLYQGKTLRTATSRLLFKIDFKEDEENLQTNLEKQIYKESRSKDISALWILLSKWKEQYPMELDERKQHLSWIKKLINDRADAIVGNTYRGKYQETAIYLCAIGEVEESFGTTNAKLRIQQEYKSKFPRHRAFHSDMSEFCKG